MLKFLKIKKGYSIFFIFGACAFLIGLHLLFSIVITPLYDYGRSFFWDEVPAVILEKDMVKVPGRKRHSSSHYRAEVTYAYTFEGSRYVSNTVSNNGNMLANDPSWLDRELEYNRQGANTFIVWVNPSNPSESYLVRSFWKGTTFLGVLMGSVFTFVGLILVRMSLIKK